VSRVINRIEITRLHSLPSGLEHLTDEAAQHGFGFLDRLVADWASGANTFSRPGECLLGAFSDNGLVGIGGLNADPFLPGTDIGRVRHVYVLDCWRHKGVGRALLDRLVSEARGRFKGLRLRSGEGAAAFYLRYGFSPVDEPTASHALKFAGSP
jgi:GNAT superfamily N-acetyltransferase